MVGKCATWFHIPAIMSAMRALDPQPFEWDVQVIPSHAGSGKKVTGMGTYGYAVSQGRQEPRGGVGLRQVPGVPGDPSWPS